MTTSIIRIMQDVITIEAPLTQMKPVICISFVQGSSPMSLRYQEAQMSNYKVIRDAI